MLVLIDRGSGATCDGRSKQRLYAHHTGGILVDGAIGAGPVGGAQCFAIDFAGWSFGDFVREILPTWAISRRLVLLWQCSITAASVSDGSFAQRYDCFHCFAPRFIRNADHCTFVNFGQRHDARFDFGGKNIEAAGDDHVLLAIDDVKEAVFVAIADVAGVVPAEFANFRGGFGQIVVAAADECAARDDFSGLILGAGVRPLLIHDCQPHGGSRFAATAEAFGMISGAAAAIVFWSRNVSSMGASVWP